jgi:hypothetical protein
MAVTAPPERRIDVRTPLLTVVGYAGAALALSATSIAVGDITSRNVEITLDAGTTIVLLAVGWLVGGIAVDAFHRMRSVFWFLAVSAWLSLLAVLFGSEGADYAPQALAIAMSLGAAVFSFPLWWLERRSLQLIPLVLGIYVLAASAVYTQSELTFFGVSVPQPNVHWSAGVTIVLGVVLFALALRGIVKPKRTALVLGALAAILGSFVVGVSLDILGGGLDTDLGIWLGLAASALVLLAGDLVDERAPSGIGIAGTLIFTAVVVDNTVHRQSVGVAVLILGLVMLAATVMLSRLFAPTPAPVPAPPPLGFGEMEPPRPAEPPGRTEPPGPTNEPPPG